MLVKKLDSTVSKIMQFVNTFTDKDTARPVLNAIHFSKKNLVSVDGFRLVVVEKPEILEDIDGNYSISKIKAGENYVELEEVSGNFPAWEQIAPYLSKEEKYKTPAMRIGIKPSLLADILRMADSNKPVILSVYDAGSPVELSGYIKQGRNEDSTPFYSVIMPTRIKDTTGFQPDKLDV